MTEQEIKTAIADLWKLWANASSSKDQAGLLAEIAWLEHKLNS